MLRYLRLAARTKTSVSLIRALTAQELWPPLVPTVVLVESLHGDSDRDANTEIGDVTRFDDARQISSWAGMTPRHRPGGLAPASNAHR